MLRIPGIGLLTVGLLTVAAIIPKVATCETPKPVQRASAKIDHPFALVAFASVDRVMARASSVADALGLPEDSQKLLVSLLGDDGNGELSTLLNSPGLDRTRPIGAMSFPHWFRPKDEDEGADEQSTFDFTKLWTDLDIESLFTGFFENAVVAICIPSKDRGALLKSMCDVANNGAELTKVEGQPGWYQLDERGTSRAGFVGNYLYVVADESKFLRSNLNFPDFDKLAKSSLGKSGFVYALYRRGLPEIVRDAMAPALKMAAAAILQRRDNEPAMDFRLRTMFGTLQTEWIDAVLSHIDEFRITGHVDSATRTILVEPEFVGTKDGKFAKLCNGLKAATSPFTQMTDQSSEISGSLSFSLPPKLWKPVSDALYDKAKSIEQPETAEILRLVAKTIESGQLDIYTSNPSWKEGVIAIRVSGNAKLPDLVQQFIVHSPGKPQFEFAIDSVDGYPIHRSLYKIPAEMPLMSFLDHLFGSSFQIPNSVDVSGLDNIAGEVTTTTDLLIQELDGAIKSENVRKSVQLTANPNSIWIAATPQTIWFGVGSSADGMVPEWFKSPMASSLAKTDASPRRFPGKGLFHLTLRGLLAGHAREELRNSTVQQERIQQAAAQKPQTNKKQDNANENQLQEAVDAATFFQELTTVARELSDTVHCELHPTETGIKLGLTFGDAYFHWFALTAKQALDSAAKQSQPTPEAAKVQDNSSNE